MDTGDHRVCEGRHVKARLCAGGCCIGSWLNTASPIAAELMAGCGFDFLAVDAEHSAIELPDVQVLFQAIRSGNSACAPLVRVPGADYASIKRFMDAGAEGVIVPLVNSASQAKEVVRAVKYPPGGERGVGFCRANQYGLALEEQFAAANARTLVCVQVEHVEGVRNLDSILASAAIDVVFVGPYDLSASMGLTAQFDHPDFRAACARILAACHQYKVAPGIHVVPPKPNDVLSRLREGYRFIAYSLDITMLTAVCTEGLASIRRGIATLQPPANSTE